ncbi:transposase [Sulfobacillus thermosulfidooxidans]|uniref:transposase n=1 Tax=Sulfobacillus thermosulfidooxidans TaxID=28034 RepID=UPI0009EA1E51
MAFSASHPAGSVRSPTAQGASLWGGNLWSPTYFAGSTGGSSLSIIKQYIGQ